MWGGVHHVSVNWCWPKSSWGRDGVSLQQLTRLQEKIKVVLLWLSGSLQGRPNCCHCCLASYESWPHSRFPLGCRTCLPPVRPSLAQTRKHSSTLLATGAQCTWGKVPSWWPVICLTKCDTSVPYCLRVNLQEQNWWSCCYQKLEKCRILCTHAATIKLVAWFWTVFRLWLTYKFQMRWRWKLDRHGGNSLKNRQVATMGALWRSSNPEPQLTENDRRIWVWAESQQHN